MRMIQKYYSLKVTLNVKKETQFNRVSDQMSILISSVMNENELLRDLHTKKGFKHYSFSTPYSNKKTLEGSCVFEIRSFDKNIVSYFMMALLNYSNEWADVREVSIRDYVFGGKITKVKSLNACVSILGDRTMKEHGIVSKYNNTYWTNELSIDILKQNITYNLSNKYLDLTGKVIDASNSTKSVCVTNSIPIAIKYESKGATLLANKIEVEFADGKEGQILARMSTVEGLLEKNTILGLGFTKAIYEKVVM